jgi:serine/threonine protein kinase
VRVAAALADHPRYAVERLLGRGGMGVVYKARHRLMDRTVALKVIQPHFLQEPSAVERFEREVKAAAALNHPNIVTAHDADHGSGVTFLVMEFVAGVPSADVAAALQSVIRELGRQTGQPTMSPALRP